MGYGVNGVDGGLWGRWGEWGLKETTLFVSHGVDGLDAHGAEGGGKAGQYAQHAEQGYGSDGCPESYLIVGGDDAVARVGELKHLQDENGKENAAHSRHTGEQNALRDNLPEDVVGRSADGAAYANFRCPLAHRHHHDVAHADGAGQQRADAHEPYEEVDAAPPC